jgi:S1-C subfamily serine protease
VRCPLAACCLLAAGGVAAGFGAGCGDSAAPQRAAPLVVAVLGQGSERATGLLVARGRVVTVAHAVREDRAVRVQARDAPPRRARILRMDRRADLALLAVPGLDGPVAAIADAALTGSAQGARAVLLRDGRILSRPVGVRRAIDAHIEAAGRRRRASRPALELEARLRDGDSGAPVQADDGRVAGVVFARSRNRADVAYATDASVLARFLGR